MEVVNDLLLSHLALGFGRLGEMEAVGPVHDVSKVKLCSELTSAIDLCQLSLLTYSKSVDVDLQNWRQLLDPEELLCILLAHRLVRVLVISFHLFRFKELSECYFKCV